MTSSLSGSAAREVVQATPGFEVAGEVATGEESVEVARTLHPDLVLMDVNLPGVGVEATRRIAADVPGSVVLLLSTRDADEVDRFAAGCGASAYIAKSAFSPQTLAAAWATARGTARRRPARTYIDRRACWNELIGRLTRWRRPWLTRAIGPRHHHRVAAVAQDLSRGRRRRGAPRRRSRGAAGRDARPRRAVGLRKDDPAQLLSGLDGFDAGTVIVEGTDLAEMSDRQRTDYRRRNMGFVFQAFNLLPVLTAVENVEIPLLLTGVGGREAHRRALDMLGHWASPTGPRTGRTSCRAASNSGSPSPGRWSIGRPWSGRTSRPATWIPRSAR